MNSFYIPCPKYRIIIRKLITLLRRSTNQWSLVSMRLRTALLKSIITILTPIFSPKRNILNLMPFDLPNWISKPSCSLLKTFIFSRPFFHSIAPSLFSRSTQTMVNSCLLITFTSQSTRWLMNHRLKHFSILPLCFKI